MISTRRREDMMVSVCIPELIELGESVRALRRLADSLTTRYRYWEVLIAVSPDGAPALEDQLLSVGNVRLLKLRHGTPFYKCRAVIAAEAIGDIVALASIEDLDVLSLVDMIDAADANGGIVIGQRHGGGFMHPLMRALGRSAGFRADGRSMLTAAFPRPLLNQLLAHPDRQLALRFPPVDAGIAVVWQPTHSRGARESNSRRNIGRRLKLVFRLLVSSAPRVLTLVALLSLLVSGSGIAFTIYSVVVLMTFEQVQPGWFTTAFVLGLTASFLGLAIFGLSIGLQKAIEGNGAEQADDIVGERSAVDLFDQVMQELNVDVEANSGRTAASRAPQDAHISGD